MGHIWINVISKQQHDSDPSARQVLLDMEEYAGEAPKMCKKCKLQAVCIT